MNGQPLTPSAVAELLRRHADEHRRMPESARLRDLGSEKALVQDYSGRVVFELLQNALDRASRRVLIRWNQGEGLLDVANDGKPVTVEAVDGRRSDLQALLSLHSSSKSAKESVGNKGVGFRSVFSAGQEVEVWSRAQDGRWWGMRMRQPSQSDPPVPGWAAQDIASFYLPRFIGADEFADAASYQDCVSLIRLRGLRRPETLANISRSVEELRRGPLGFLSRRAPPDIEVILHSSGGETVQRLGAQDWLAIRERSIDVPDAVRASTGLDLDKAEVRVLAQTEPDVSRYWSYLPTEQPAGFGVQVHADFYLSNSRRNLALRRLEADAADSDPAGWNSRLVELAADLVLELWQTPAVCEAPHFWDFATPRACTCNYLRDAVARRLWADRCAVFETMARLSFPPGRTWHLGRYRHLFEALDAWADYAYRSLGSGPLYQRRQELLDRLQASGAPVLPIMTGDPTQEESLPLEARPLVAGVKGQRRPADADRIYFRGFDPEAPVSLPPEVRRQRTFVTTFSPGLDLPLARQGLLEFERPEILAQLQPGEAPEEHGPLLSAALDLARQETRGGLGPLLRRAGEFAVGPAWRFTATETIARAGRSLSALKVKTLDGDWEPAHRCGRARGPWPRVDDAWVVAVCDGLDEPPSIEDCCLLLGIGPVPLDDAGVPPLPEELPEETLWDLMAQWPQLAGFLERPAGAACKEALERCRWLRATDDLDIRDGAGEGPPYAPLDLWWQYPNRGFTTNLLPRLVLDGRERPDWLSHLGISNPQDFTSQDRLLRALGRLRQLEPGALDNAEQRDLSELYRSLTGLMLRWDEPAPIPLLYRATDAAGVQQHLAWGSAQDGIWHDTGEFTGALRAFANTKVWVVRKAGEKKAEALGLRNFRPAPPIVHHHGDPSDVLASALEGQLRRALPDLVAAACNGYAEFRAEEAIHAFSGLRIRQFQDVWIEWSFDGRSGSLGRQEKGDVFSYRREDGGMEILFDGERIPVVDCALPLSELLADNRAFGSLFRDGLYAWSHGEGETCAAIQRFRREHGISDQDVAHWQERISAQALTPAERQAWVSQVRQALEVFGTLKRDPEPGMWVRPDCFEVPRHASEQDLRLALEGIEPLRPRVDFAGPHRLRLERTSRLPALAAAAEGHRGHWTEDLLRSLQQRADTPLPDEAERTQWLDFDADAEIRRRLGLAQDAAPAADDAMAFARGRIPLVGLPEAPVVLAPRGFRTGPPNLHPMEAQSAEDFIQEARRKHSGGRRAEEAVLDLAVAMALQWHREDSGGFADALSPLLQYLGDKGCKRAGGIEGEPGMRALLHVADYVGNAGFDLLVPREGRFLLVEVKRVASLSNAAFFLSENERRRAADYREHGHDWRLWLITASGQALDATRALDAFDRHAGSLDGLAADGLRPGEWFLVLSE